MKSEWTPSVPPSLHRSPTPPSGLAIYFYLEGMKDERMCCPEENSSNGGEGVPYTSLSPPELPTARGQWLWGVGMSAVKYTLFGCFVLGLNRLHHSCHDYRRKRRKRRSSGDQVRRASLAAWWYICKCTPCRCLPGLVASFLGFTYVCRSLVLSMGFYSHQSAAWERG